LKTPDPIYTNLRHIYMILLVGTNYASKPI
jgi:hypothetical protein